MTLACAVKSCKSHEQNDDTNTLLYFPFPEDEERLREWALRSGRTDILEKSTPEAHLTEYLCERHFEEHCLDRTGPTILKPKAVPTLFDHDIGQFTSEMTQGKDLGNIISPDIVVIPCVIMENGINTEVIGYDGEVVKEECDGNDIERHLQLMEEGTYMEAQVIPQSSEGLVENCLQPVQGLESATLIIDGITTVQNEEWPEDELANRLCRVCATEKQELVHVFEDQGIELQLLEKIQWHLPIMVKEDDKLPRKLCTTCISMLNSWDELIRSCVEANNKLRRMFKISEEQYDELMGSGATVLEMVPDNRVFHQNRTVLKQNGRMEVRGTKRFPVKSPRMLKAMQLLRKAKGTADRVRDQPELTGSINNQQLPTEVIIHPMDIETLQDTEEDAHLKPEGTVNIENLDSGSKVVDVCIESLGPAEEGSEPVQTSFQVTVPVETECDSLLQTTIVEAIQDIMEKGAEEVEEEEVEEEEDEDEETASMRERRKSLRLKEWKCEICGYDAPRKSSLLLHQRRKHPPQYACNYCDKIFNNALAMKVHERSHTRLHMKSQEPTRFVCEYCGKSFRTKKTLKEHHISAHSDHKPYQCDKCEKNYGSLSSLDIHMATHSSETPYLCDLCGKTFKHVSNLRSHKRSHLDDMVKNRQVCSKCGKGFRSRFHLSEHMNVHYGIRPYSCDVCGKHFHKKIQLRQHGSAHSGTKPYKCPICGVKFNRRGNMTQHIKRHDHERKYTCRVCSESFPTLGAVLTHRKKHTDSEVERSIQLQSGDDPDQVAFKCEVCGKLLAKRETLSIHMRSHTGEKLFECTVCGKKLSNKGTLTYHMRSFHTGERPHICQFCGEGFLSKEARLVHERIHTGEKPYECSTCSMAFRCSSNLAQHSRVHSDARPHPCPHCGKGFQRKGALVVHIRTHTGERPYACDICGRAFTQKNDMLKHRRTHTHEKPFRCEHCGQLFSQKRDLTKHLQIHGTEQEVEQDQQTQTVVITTSDHLITFPEINVPVMENSQTLILHRF